jgi:hypothetical protein
MKILIYSLAIVFLASSLVSLFFISSATFDKSPIGQVTNNQNGTISIIVDDTLAITLTNETINFGTCAINTTKGFAILDSSTSSSGADNDDCLNGIFPSYLSIRNIGNVLANVSVQFNESGHDFFQDNTSWLAYMTNNTPIMGGCAVNASQDIFNITLIIF